MPKNPTSLALSVLLAVTVAAALPAQSNFFDLTPHRDVDRHLRNPHKGWYQHYYDNWTGEYGGTPAEVRSVGGLNHLYVRLPWEQFEPEEDRYDWSLITDLAATYAPLGYRIVVLVSALETGKKYATPQWVQAKGAQGREDLAYGETTVWIPDWDDPVYLSELRDFHEAFYAKFGRANWLAYVEMGSIGVWGEGHLSATENGQVPTVGEVKAHIDLYNEVYQRRGVQVLIGDDYAFWGKSGSDKSTIVEYANERNFGWNDDSGLVGYYVETFSGDCGLNNADIYEDSYLHAPLDLELGHYDDLVERGYWSEPNGSKLYTGPGGYPAGTTHYDLLECQIATGHMTYVSFHGLISEWGAGNRKAIRTLGNRMGYWYGLRSARLPSRVATGSTATVHLTWENMGVAPAYNRYALEFRFEGATPATVVINDSKNRNWADGERAGQSYALKIPDNLDDDVYVLKVRMVDRDDTKRVVDLALSNEIRDSEGFFRLGTLAVRSRQTNPNLARNWSFERDGGIEQEPSSWSTWSSTGAAQADFTESNGGDSHGDWRLTHYLANTSNWNCYTSQEFRGIPNGTYVLRAKARKGGSGFVDAHIEAKVPNGPVLGSANVPTSNKMQQLEVRNIQVKGNACTIALYTEVGNGSAYPYVHLDAFEFYRQVGTSGRESQTTSQRPDVRAYPNPSEGEVVFDRPVSGTLIDRYGTVIRTLEETNEVDLSSYPAGLYLLRLREGGEVVKIVRH